MNNNARPKSIDSEMSAVDDAFVLVCVCVWVCVSVWVAVVGLG